MSVSAILQDALDGYNISICARAGAGKTTTILAIAKALFGKKIEILTYNRALANECTAKIEIEQIDATCSTLHAKFSRCCGVICNDDFAILEQEQVARFEADIIMIDEVQDMRPLLFDALMKMIPLQKQIIIVGDELQILYDFYVGDEATDYILFNPQIAFANVTQNEWKMHRLEGSYRLTKSCCAFVNRIWDSKIQSLSKEPDLPVDFIITNPWQVGITKLIQQTIDKYGSANTMILASTLSGNTPIRKHVNKLLKQGYLFHVKEFARGFDNSEEFKDRTRVWTFCSSKGCEADAVIVFGMDISPNANDLGVACSRAKKKLIVIHNERSPVNKAFQGIPYHLRFMEVSSFGDIIHHKNEITFGDIEERDFQRERFTVCDRLSISSQVLYSIFKNFVFETTTVHESRDLNTLIEFSHGSEDVSALYGKQIEYLIQVHCGHVCSDAQIVQMPSLQMTSKKQVTDFFEKNAITCLNIDALNNIEFPISGSLMKSHCNTRKIILQKNDQYIRLVTDTCDEIYEIHQQLQSSKSEIDAMKLANFILALDSYEDRKTTIKNYNWISPSISAILQNAMTTMPNLKDGSFEHYMQYRNEDAKTITGKVDWMLDDTVMDFKMTSEITPENKQQIVTYTALHAFNKRNDAIGILYYLRLGIMLKFKMTYEDAIHFLQDYVNMRMSAK